MRNSPAPFADVVAFKADLVYDTSRPDGTPRKLVTPTKLQRSLARQDRAAATAREGV